MSDVREHRQAGTHALTHTERAHIFNHMHARSRALAFVLNNVRSAKGF